VSSSGCQWRWIFCHLSDNHETDRDAGEEGKNFEARACACPTSNRVGSAASSISSISTIEGVLSLQVTCSIPLTAPTVQNVSWARPPHIELHQRNWVWREGEIYHGHPSIIPLLNFFEDAHYYYLILPAAKPSFHPPPFPLPLQSHSSSPYGYYIPRSSHLPSLLPPHFPSDLFDLVERYPMGLLASLIRSYLGQIAHALAFLHVRGICNRGIKDENVGLAEDGRGWLMDFLRGIPVHHKTYGSSV
jgi:hypothetical protein